VFLGERMMGSAGMEALRATGVAAAVITSVLSAFSISCGARQNPTDAYRASATSLCKAEEREISAIEKPTSGADFRRYLSEVLPLVEKRIDRLQRLDPPSTLRGDHQRIIDLSKTAAFMIAAQISRLDRGPDLSVTAAVFRNLDSLRESERRIWSQLGVDECASGPKKTQPLRLRARVSGVRAR
jgi:hypothetical protein